MLGAQTARTVRVGDEDAHRRVALHRARADDASIRGAVREAEIALASASAASYLAEDADDRETARMRAVAASERLAAARADLVIVSAAIERLGGRR